MTKNARFVESFLVHRDQKIVREELKLETEEYYKLLKDPMVLRNIVDRLVQRTLSMDRLVKVAMEAMQDIVLNSSSERFRLDAAKLIFDTIGKANPALMKAPPVKERTKGEVSADVIQFRKDRNRKKARR